MGLERKILIVEDDFSQQQLLVKWIGEMNRPYTIYTAGTDQEALEIAFTENIDLFIMDIDLNSEMNGFEVATRIRTFPRYNLTWILFLTVETSFELKAYREVQCHAFLDKPYPKELLQGMVTKLLDNSGATDNVSHAKFLVAEADQVLIRIKYDEIVFIEAKGRGSYVYTLRGNYQLPYKSLKSIEELLKDETEFYKAHRSFIINTYYVKAIHKLGLKQYEIEFYNCQSKSLLSKKNKEILEEKIGLRRE